MKTQDASGRQLLNTIIDRRLACTCSFGPSSRVSTYPRTLGAAVLLLCFLLTIALVGCQPIDTDTRPNIGSVNRISAKVDSIIDRTARPVLLADGFEWSEGPVWVKDGSYLLFSDVPTNTVFRWSDSDGLSEFLHPSGYTGESSEARDGANGLLVAPDGSLLLAQHGDRRIASLAIGQEAASGFKTVSDTFEGKRYNSPNDLVISDDGSMYFTDPPYGLPGQDRSELKEQNVNGVYRISPAGMVTLQVDSLMRPNGIGISPDGRTLYVSNSEPGNEIIGAYDISLDGDLSNGRMFFDARELAKLGLPGLPDGMAVDINGNLFATGPGGVLILSPTGEHLGTISTGSAVANCAFGKDGTVLFLTADMNLASIQTRTTGLGF